MMQWIAVTIALIAAASYCIWRLVRMFRGKGGNSCAFCDGCAKPSPRPSPPRTASKDTICDANRDM